MSGRAVLLAVCGLTCAPVPAAVDLDALSRNLQFVSADGNAWAGVSVAGDVTAYHVAQPPPGLLTADQDTFVAPRVSATLDAGLGQRLAAHLRVTADRGFDPLFEEDGDVRLDEAFLQLELSREARATVRLGKFPTAFGAWVERHLPWDNPLISGPLAYDDMVTITDAAVPADASELLGRRDLPENKAGWVPLVWGPSYATGGRLSAGFGRVDLSVELKNASLSSRPETWAPGDRGFDDGPTVTGRARWQPDPAWTLGASFSDGAYLRKGAAASLEPGLDVDDVGQRTAGLDVGYEHRDLQLWGEVIYSRFEVPGIGDVAATSGFVEFRYKPAPRLWLAGRWNQSWFDRVAGESWDRDVRAADIGIGFRLTPHTQAKLQYRWIDQQGADPNGRHVLAAQVMAWF